MSTNPPANIEIAWGGGKWNSGHKRAVRPWVTTAVEITNDALDHFGIASDEQKQAMIYRSSKPEDYGAACHSRRFEMYIPSQAIRHRKVGKHATELALTAFHEAVHCVRMESNNEQHLIEKIAAEGVAYHAERALAHELLLSHEMHLVAESSLFKPLSPAAQEQILSALLTDAATAGQLDPEAGTDMPYIEEIYGYWLEEPFINGPPLGLRIGISAVGSLLDNGVSLAHVINMPSEDIMGIAI